jgi:hypothetical protein
VLLDPAGGVARAKLGKLLRADLLITLREVEGSPPSLMLSVCETMGGLRLLTRQLPAVGTVESQTDTLAALVAGAIAKRQEGITEICAIPPFVNQDFERKFDTLQAAYAKVVEQALLKRRGTLVVELEEAQSIGRELAIGGISRVMRQAPLYVLGEFRSSKGTDGSVELKIIFKRGEKEVQRMESPPLPAERVGKYLLQAVNLLPDVEPVTVTRPATAPTSNPAKIEAAELRARGELFQSLGNNLEALALYEASLLLDVRQPRVHYNAVVLLKKLPERDPHIADFRVSANAHAEELLENTARETEHLEAFLHGARLTGGDGLTGAEIDQFICDNAMLHSSFGSLPFKKRMLELERQRSDVVLSVLTDRVRAENYDFMYSLHWIGVTIAWVYDADREEKKERCLRFINAIKDVPQAEFAANSLLQLNYDYDATRDAAFLKRVAEIDGPTARAAAEGARRYLAELHASRLEYDRMAATQPGGVPLPVYPKPRNGSARIAGKLTLEPIAFTAVDAEGHSCDLPRNISGWQNYGGVTDHAFDLVRDNRAVYLLREPGKLIRIYSNVDPRTDITEMGFDGKYVWIVFKKADPLLVIVDAVSLQQWSFTAADGLMPMTLGAVVCGLKPGHAMVGGGFGRAWLAMADFDPKHGLNVKVFLEAREERNVNDYHAWEGIHLPFTPRGVTPLIAPDGRTRGIIVGRHRDEPVGGGPLWIDPATLEVRAWAGTDYAPVALSKYATQPNGRVTQIGWTLVRYLSDPSKPLPPRKAGAYDCLTDEQIVVFDEAVHLSPRGIFILDGELFFLGSEVWSSRKPLESMDKWDVPVSVSFGRARPSAVYGPIIFSNNASEAQSMPTIYRIRLTRTSAQHP